MKSFSPAAFMAASALLISPALAHHGQEFFLLYDAQVQKPLHGILQGNFSFIDEGTDDSIGLSPSLSLGILPRTAFNLRADFSDEAGEGWAYRSIEPGFQFDLTPPHLKMPLRIGLSVAYQFAGDGGGGHSPAATDLSGGTIAHVHHDEPATGHSDSHAGSAASAETAHDHSTHEHNPPPVSPSGIDPGPDALTPEELAAMAAQNAANPPNATTAAAPAAASPAKRKPKPSAKRKAETHDHTSHPHGEDGGHSHAGGIHNHDDNLFTARLIFEADLTPRTLLVANLINVLPEGGSAAWGYALGLRQRLRPGLSIGMEALGDFDANKHQEVLGAVFWEPVPHVLFKVGVGTGLSSVSPDATLRAGVLWMF
jgi:hypothetical protein